MEDPSGTEISQKLRILGIIRGALLLSIVIYYALSYFLPSGQEADGSTMTMLTLVLAAVAFSVVVMGTFLRKTFLSDEKILEKAGFNPAAGEMPEQQGILRAVAYWSTWNIVTWALYESVALYGFVLYMLGARREQFAVFAAIAFLCMLVIPPRIYRIRSVLRC